MVSAQFGGNDSHQEPTGVNLKSGQEVAKINRRPGSFGKTDQRYWLGRVFRNSYRKDGKTLKTKDWCVRIRREGRRETFNLGTPNREAAARKALEVYLRVVSEGWEQALAAFKPKAIEPEPEARELTVGYFLEAVRATAGFRPATLATYEQKLRQIAAGIAGITGSPAAGPKTRKPKSRESDPGGLSRHDTRSGGRQAWLEAVDALPLGILTPESIQRWKIAYIARAGAAPDKQRHARNSANSIIINARALFSEKALSHVIGSVALPEPLPFTGVKLERRGSTRYISRIDAPTLIAKARAELSGDPYAIFLLALCCGLRKREIDSLRWRQVDFVSGQIRIEPTEDFAPKTEDSIGTVDIEAEILDILRGIKAAGGGDHVIAPQRKRSRARVGPCYRCEPEFRSLYAWLRVQGISARKPLHELRKELGAILASEKGIFAAQSVLRHAQISTTSEYYADKKTRITSGLGAFLRTEASQDQQP
jgi:integrase